MMKSNKNATLLIIINQCHPSKLRHCHSGRRLWSCLLFCFCALSHYHQRLFI